ncbi:hypothetical protein AAG906_010357 [Vitis piasezkii]
MHPLCENFRSCETTPWHTILVSIKPESPKMTLFKAPYRASTPSVVPPLVEDTPLSPPSRRYKTRRPPTTPGASSSRAKKSGSCPPKKKARVSAPIESSKPSSEPPSEPQSSQPPATKWLSDVPWSLNHPLRVIWIPGQGHSTPSFALTQLLSNFNQSSRIPSICCKGTIWST